MPAPYKRTAAGRIPSSEYRRRAKIRATMRRRVAEKRRDSRGRFTTTLWYGITDVRERSTDFVDYGVPWVLSADWTTQAVAEANAEDRLVETFSEYAFWEVGVYATFRPLLERLAEREQVDDDEAKVILREMEDEATTSGGALAPLHLEERVTNP